MSAIKVFTTFSGYDSQCLAFKYANVPFELIGWSEIDEYAIKAHNALFPEACNRNYGDIKSIDWNNVPDFDFLTYSSPCTDISKAGDLRGMNKDSNTRSSLLWYVENAIKTKRPKYLLMENVQNIVSTRYVKDFNIWIDILKENGYTSYWTVLNSIDYNIPQKRKRLFCVSIRNDIQQSFDFPQPINFTYTLHNIFDNDVDDKFYLNEQKTQDIVSKMVKFDEWDDKIQSEHFNIRHISTKECFRLMGVHDDDADKIINAVTSSIQQYKFAGNSIVVDCLIHIYKELFKEYKFDLPYRHSRYDNRKSVMIGYTRDHKGNVVNYHPIEISNVITTMTGNGWTQDIYILETY